MSETKTTQINQKCSTCGGNLVFNPTRQSLVCERCGNIAPVSGVTTTEKSLQLLLSNAPKWQKDTVVWQCEHCGAKSVVTKTDLVAKCEYCGRTNLLKTGELPGVRPDTVVPFKFDQKEADRIIRGWLSRRCFAPNRYKRQLTLRHMSGVYYPAFTFDAQTTTVYRGVAVSTETNTRTVDGHSISESFTSRRPVHGFDQHVFDDVLVVANNAITAETIHTLAPFDTNHGQCYQNSYLSGYTVFQSTIEPTACWEMGKKSMHRVIYDKITTKYGDVRLENLDLDMKINNVTYKHVLLPIYVGYTEYNNKKYEIYINGQTGKVSGKTPKSGWKIFTFFASMAVAVFGFGILLAALL